MRYIQTRFALTWRDIKNQEKVNNAKECALFIGALALWLGFVVYVLPIIFQTQ